jgi:hypothetical protein
MAPRALETKQWFLVRLKHSWKADGSARVRFGQHHWTHAVVLEEGRLRVRRLELPEGAAEAHMKKHGMFMPEHAEMLSEPIGKVVYEAASLDELVALIEQGPWPL